MDLFRKFFGLPTHEAQRGDLRPSNPEEDPSNFFFGRNNANRPDDFSGGWHGSSFNVFSEPLEMHRYFEQQMDHLMKSFGMPNFGNFFRALEHPGMPDDSFNRSSEEEYSPNKREHFLKGGYEKPTFEHPADKVDKDLDGKLTITDLDTIFENPKDNFADNFPSGNNGLSIFGEVKPFGGKFFNQSVQVKTVRSADGSLETQRIVTDSEGNQETTITKRVGDKEYTIVKKRDKEGKEEIHETLINMNEDEKSRFTSPQEPAHPHLFDHTIFSKFFK